MTAMARVQAQHGPKKASVLSVILARHWASKSCSPSRATSQFSRKFALLVALVLLLALALLHAVMIVRSASNLSTFPWFHSVCASVSMFTINTDNFLSLFLFPCWCLRVCIGSLCIPKLQPFTRSITSFVSLHFVVECGIHCFAENQSCNLNNIAVLKQRLASFQHLRNSSPCCFASNRSAKEFSVSPAFNSVPL